MADGERLSNWCLNGLFGFSLRGASEGFVLLTLKGHRVGADSETRAQSTCVHLHVDGNGSSPAEMLPSCRRSFSCWVLLENLPRRSRCYRCSISINTEMKACWATDTSHSKKKKKKRQIYIQYRYMSVFEKALKSALILLGVFLCVEKSAKLVLKVYFTEFSSRLWTKCCTEECYLCRGGSWDWSTCLYMQSCLQLTPKRKRRGFN